jgi:dTDP-4-dehydrorhamnose reductase
MPPLEVWAGIECTVNRVGDRYLDQLARSGHDRRLDDLERLAALGVRALRYPALWERTAPGAIEAADWRWLDERLAELRRLGVRPIAGLCHHGSGPRHTNLLADDFAPGLAAYAGAVARRYPWLDAYTPVNEPLTTARFSALYGHWYPHARDDRAFVRAVASQCRATVLAMQAVRAINPAAALVQTEDLGFTRAAPTLQYQADFENARRWLSLDLLCGKVGRDHALADWLRWIGADLDELAWFADHPCPPDVIGVNYYVTSERWLATDLDAWPPSTHGGNGRHRYADVEAVRACGLVGVAALLEQVWQRFHLPIAITEAHLGCTRDEQVRWLVELWDGAIDARARGVPVHAVTAWAAFGSFDWDTLVTCESGRYEPGLFDVRSTPPRPTALAAAVRALAAGRRPDHPLLEGAGWWRRHAPAAIEDAA